MKRSPAKKTAKKVIKPVKKSAAKPLAKIKIARRKLIVEPSSGLFIKSPVLQVSHRKHTAKLLPHRATSYPLIALLLTLTGVAMLSLPAGMAKADDYDVHLSVPGLPPAQPASITAPNDGAVFTSVPITVRGNCPVGTYVKLYRNDVFSGVGSCASNGTFAIQTDLFPGANQLVTKDYSVTDLEGPASTPITVRYQPPKSIPSTGTGTSPSKNGNSASDPLLINYEFTYRGVYTDQLANYELGLNGGKAPYAMQVDWGDGGSDVYSVKEAGKAPISHRYKGAGTQKITISVSDSEHNKTSMQLIAIVVAPAGTATHKPDAGGTSGGPSFAQKINTYLWPTYGAAVFGAFTFWLGEVYEIRKLGGRRSRQA